MEIGEGYYIGYSTDNQIRYDSASGGIGSAFIKFLLSLQDYGTAVSFIFDKELCRYIPKLIYTYNEYNNCGSIYQDIDLITFIKQNLEHISRGIIITCLPCQVRPLKTILDKNGIKSFIISFCCSGQTSVEGTWLYYKFNRINKYNVETIQYRGKGWPSGIQILEKDGSIIKKDNYTYPWTTIHQSFLFCPRRCILCPVKVSSDADVVLADPWLEEYIKIDTIGNTLFIVQTVIADCVLKKMAELELIKINQVNKDIFIKSQRGTIEAKANKKLHLKYYKFLLKLNDNARYKRIVSISPVFLKFHNLFIGIMHHIL